MFLCFPAQSWHSWSLTSRSQVQRASSRALLTASWRRVNGSVPAQLYDVHSCFLVWGYSQRLNWRCPPPAQNLRQLRLDLQKLGAGLQSGERACCRNTGGERLRQALTAADETLAKQVRPKIKRPTHTSPAPDNQFKQCNFWVKGFFFLVMDFVSL